MLFVPLRSFASMNAQMRAVDTLDKPQRNSEIFGTGLRTPFRQFVIA